MKQLSSTAMILAAGLGTRMRPLTLDTPKPLLPVGGRSMLDRALDHLVAFGINRVVINTHYLAEQITAHIANRHDVDIIISHEATILDTGGGIKQALSHFNNQPFLALNADLPWLDGHIPALSRMAAMWDDERMDALLLLMPKERAHGFGDPATRRGDFMCDADGHTHRRDVPPPYPYVMLSAQIVRPQLFTHITEPVFSNNRVWDMAEAKGRLYGLIHDGQCYHIGTPHDWEEANRRLTTAEGWA